MPSFYKTDGKYQEFIGQNATFITSQRTHIEYTRKKKQIRREVRKINTVLFCFV